MLFAASCSKPASPYAHGNTRWQQSCSHSTAICNHRFKTRIELRRTQRRNPLHSEQPQPHLPHTGGTFHRRPKPLYTEKHTVSCSGFLPNISPMQHPCSHYNALPLPLVITSQCHHTPFVTISPKSPHPLCHHPPSSPLPLVSHRPSSMSFLLWCIVMWCQVSHHPSSMSILLCDVLLCDVKSHTTLHQCQFFCDVLLCDVKSHITLHQCQFFCVMYCYVMSSLTPPFINVNSFVMYCYVMSSLAPPFINVNSFVMWCQVADHPSSMSILLCDVLLCNVKSHTTLHQCQFFCDVLLCDVKSRATLHQCQFFCYVIPESVWAHGSSNSGGL